MLLGIIAGFVVTLTVGLRVGNAWPVIFLQTAVSALVLGLLARWWAGVWQSTLRQAAAEHASRSESQRKQAKDNHTPGKT